MSDLAFRCVVDASVGIKLFVNEGPPGPTLSAQGTGPGS